MIDLGPLQVLSIMFGSLVILLLIGVPALFALGGIGVLLIILVWEPKLAASTLVATAYEVTTWYTLIALPQFIFMAKVLQLSGVAEKLFRSIRLWLAWVPGGLAMAAVIVSVFIAAMQGATAMGVLVLGIIAVPIMLKFGYSKQIAIGPILAGACLASLIPPSGQFIIYGALARVSVGQLFIGGVVPGLILACLYIVYIGIRCYLKPELGPPLPKEERVDLREKLLSLRALVSPVFLIVAVLGSIFAGIASATEAASVGAAGSLIIAAIERKLNWRDVKESLIETAKVMGMIMWIFIGAYCFKSVFVLSGGPHVVTNWVAGLGMSPLGVAAIMQLVFIVLGCFVQVIVMMLISLPVFLPIIDALGLNRLWYGVLFMTSTQLADLTPPFGFALFFMRSVAPEGVTMGDIIRSILPFLPLQCLVIILLLLVPDLALWLPKVMLS